MDVLRLIPTVDNIMTAKEICEFLYESACEMVEEYKDKNLDDPFWGME